MSGPAGPAYDTDAVKTIAAAVYPAMLNEPVTVRTRAQAAYTIASAIAAALVTGGAVAHIQDFGFWIELLGALAVAAWLVTAGLFINISRRVRKIPRAEGGALTIPQFVSQSLAVAVNEADDLEKQLTHAAYGTYVALALTGLALAGALVQAPEPDRPVSTIRLTPYGVEAVKAQCPNANAALTGTLHPETLDDAYAVIDIKDTCGSGTVTMRIPPSYIAAIGSAR